MAPVPHVVTLPLATKMEILVIGCFLELCPFKTSKIWKIQRVKTIGEKAPSH